jgi:hypothetical protein
MRWLATGVGCAATYVRDPQILQRTLTQTPASCLAMPGEGPVEHIATSTVVRGRFAIRPCYINPRTTAADVDSRAEAMVRLGDILTN